MHESFYIRDVMQTTRITAAWATVGPEFNAATMLYEPSDESALVKGFVCRNRQTNEIKDLRMLTPLDSNKVSPGQASRTSFKSDGTLIYYGKAGFCDYAAFADTAKEQHIPADDAVSLGGVQAGLSKIRSLEIPISSLARAKELA